MNVEKFSSPIGLMIRGPDRWATQGGAWHASRGRPGRPRLHEGVDLVTVPGQPIIAPVPVTFVHLYPGIQDHVHVEVRLANGKRVDPTPWFFKAMAARAVAGLRA